MPIKEKQTYKRLIRKLQKKYEGGDSPNSSLNPDDEFFYDAQKEGESQ